MQVARQRGRDVDVHVRELRYVMLAVLASVFCEITTLNTSFRRLLGRLRPLHLARDKKRIVREVLDVADGGGTRYYLHVDHSGVPSVKFILKMEISDCKYLRSATGWCT